MLVSEEKLVLLVLQEGGLAASTYLRTIAQHVLQLLLLSKSQGKWVLKVHSRLIAVLSACRGGAAGNLMKECHRVTTLLSLLYLVNDNPALLLFLLV